MKSTLSLLLCALVTCCSATVGSYTKVDLSYPGVIKAAEHAVSKINMRLFSEKGHQGLRLELAQAMQGNRWLEVKQIAEVYTQVVAGTKYKITLRLANPLNRHDTLVSVLDMLGSEKSLRLYQQWRSKTNWPTLSTKNNDEFTRRFLFGFLMAVDPAQFNLMDPYVGEQDEMHEVIVYEDLNGNMDLLQDNLVEKLPREATLESESDEQELSTYDHNEPQQEVQQNAQPEAVQSVEHDEPAEMKQEVQAAALNAHKKKGKKNKKKQRNIVEL